MRRSGAGAPDVRVALQSHCSRAAVRGGERGDSGLRTSTGRTDSCVGEPEAKATDIGPRFGVDPSNVALASRHAECDAHQQRSDARMGDRGTPRKAAEVDRATPWQPADGDTSDADRDDDGGREHRSADDTSVDPAVAVQPCDKRGDRRRAHDDEAPHRRHDDEATLGPGYAFGIGGPFPADE